MNHRAVHLLANLYDIIRVACFAMFRFVQFCLRALIYILCIHFSLRALLCLYAKTYGLNLHKKNEWKESCVHNIIM